MLRVNFLVATAFVEFGAGLLLLSVPSFPLSLLLGVSQAASEMLVLARIAGAALLSLGVACWLARKDDQSRAATGLIAAMLLYNVTVAALLAFAGIIDGMRGVALWPGVALHAAMAVWCIACMKDRLIGVGQ